jgi:hypothetical protein
VSCVLDALSVFCLRFVPFIIPLCSSSALSHSEMSVCQGEVAWSEPAGPGVVRRCRGVGVGDPGLAEGPLSTFCLLVLYPANLIGVWLTSFRISFLSSCVKSFVTVRFVNVIMQLHFSIAMNSVSNAPRGTSIT